MEALRKRIADDRRLIAGGGRPAYRVSTTYDGSAFDVRVRELPTVHVFVPDTASALEGARGLIAQTLGVPESSFDVIADEG